MQGRPWRLSPARLTRPLAGGPTARSEHAARHFRTGPSAAAQLWRGSWRCAALLEAAVEPRQQLELPRPPPRAPRRGLVLRRVQCKKRTSRLAIGCAFLLCASEGLQHTRCLSPFGAAPPSSLHILAPRVYRALLAPEIKKEQPPAKIRAEILSSQGVCQALRPCCGLVLCESPGTIR